MMSLIGTSKKPVWTAGLLGTTMTYMPESLIENLIGYIWIPAWKSLIIESLKWNGGQQNFQEFKIKWLM